MRAVFPNDTKTDCPDCRIYFCPNCKLWNPWEIGCAHEDPKDDCLCDKCWCDRKKYRKYRRAKREQRHSAFLAYWWRKRQFGRWQALLSSEVEDEACEHRDQVLGIDQLLVEELMVNGQMPDPRL
jgi:hypothetical protein